MGTVNYNTIATPVDVGQAKLFVDTLWPKRVPGDVVMTLLRTRSKVERRQETVDPTIGQFLDNLQTLVDEGWNVYLTPSRFNPRREPGPKSRKARDVVFIPGVWVDMDVKEDVDILPQTEAELEAVLAACPDPTMVVRTGSGGAHMYWLYHEGLTDIQKAKKINPSWITYISDIASRTLGRDIKFDSVGDLSRILRVPGTYRHPKPPYKEFKSHPVELESWTGPRYDVSDIESRVRPGIDRIKNRLGGTTTGNKIDVPIDDPHLQAFIVDEVNKNASRFENWIEGVPPGRNSMLNRAAFFLGQLAEWGLDQETARDALMRAARNNGLMSADGESACDATFESGWNSGVTQPRHITQMMLEGKEAHDGTIIMPCKDHYPSLTQWVYDQLNGKYI